MRILYVTTISLTMNTFFKPHIDMLVKEGHEVDIACNYRELAVDAFYTDLGCQIYQIDFSRYPLSRDNVRACGQLRKVVETGRYDIVHCHTPNASVVTRLVCRKLRKKTGLKVFYTAHGFHFYKGAPKLNWLVFYPIEKLCSRFTDKLITINQEDYQLARKKFKAGEVCYVPGVGIDLSRFENIQVDRRAKREEIGIPEDAFMLFSVGELNENKNHQIIIRAMARLNHPHVHYAIAGVGDKREYLLALAEELGVADRVHLLGYRKDIPELNHVANLFCFPSIREGLAVSIMEAMACGLPCAVSAIRGNVDLIDSECGHLVSPTDTEGWARAIGSMYENRGMLAQMGKRNQERVKRCTIDAIVTTMDSIYESL